MEFPKFLATCFYNGRCLTVEILDVQPERSEVARVRSLEGTPFMISSAKPPYAFDYVAEGYVPKENLQNIRVVS